MTLTREQILAKRAELPREIVEIAELGGSVMVRALMLKEVREFQRLQKTTGEPLSIYPRLVAWGLVNENGQPLFVGEDIKLIDEFSWGVTNAIATAVLRLSGMDVEPKTEGREKTEGRDNGVPKESLN